MNITKAQVKYLKTCLPLNSEIISVEKYEIDNRERNYRDIRKRYRIRVKYISNGKEWVTDLPAPHEKARK